MGFDFSKYNLVIADCDGTLYERDGLVKLPWTDKLIEAIRTAGVPWCIASNQGGVACNEAGWSTSAANYPTLDEVFSRFASIQHQLMPDRVYLSFAFYNKKSAMWCFPSSLPERDIRCSRAWRKPNPGMLLQAQTDFNIEDERKVLMIGDSGDDEGAAENAGCTFIHISKLVEEMGL